MRDPTSTTCVAIVPTLGKNYRKIAQENWKLDDEQMVGMHVHHRIPVSQGGTNDPSNLYVCSPWFHAYVWHGPGAVLERGWKFRENFRHSEETKQHLSKIQLGSKQSEETKQKRSNSLKVHWEQKTEQERKEWGQRTIESLSGRVVGPCTERRKQLLSEHFTGYEFPKTKCPHCGKVGTIAPMTRWHFDNCKHKHA